MAHNIELIRHIEAYLVSHNYIFKGQVPNKPKVWSAPNQGIEVALPDVAMSEHPQSEELIQDAIYKLATERGLSVSDFLKVLEADSADILEVRAAGSRIEHGRIHFEEALSALEGLYSVLKYSAKDSLPKKGRKALLRDYLKGVNLIAPGAGSFIYRTEIQLLEQAHSKHDENELIENTSIGRYLNEQFIIRLSSILKHLSSGALSVRGLYEIGLSTRLCNYLLKLFSESSDLLEFNVVWSFREPVNDELPTKLTFDRSQRAALEKAKDLLSQTRTVTYKDLPALIEKYIWPKEAEMGKVSVRLLFDNQELVCTLDTDEQTYDELKELKAKTPISISAKLLLTEDVKKSVEILEVEKIIIDRNREIKF